MNISSFYDLQNKGFSTRLKVSRLESINPDTGNCYSQIVAADIAMIDYKTLARWENGKNTPQSEKHKEALRILEDLYDVPMGFLNKDIEDLKQGFRIDGKVLSLISEFKVLTFHVMRKGQKHDVEFSQVEPYLINFSLNNGNCTFNDNGKIRQGSIIGCSVNDEYMTYNDFLNYTSKIYTLIRDNGRTDNIDRLDAAHDTLSRGIHNKMIRDIHEKVYKNSRVPLR